MLGQIEAFVAVARAGSVRKAAEALSLSEPAVSARIAVLEESVGARLFQRGKRGMSLTPAGQAFMAHGVQALDAVDAGRRTIADLVQGVDGELVIGAASSIAAYIIPDVVARFRRTHPRIRVVVRTRPSAELVELVVGGEVHVGLVGELLDPRVDQTPLYDEDLILVAGPDDPLVNESSMPIPAARLRDQTLILFDRGCAYDDMTRAMLRASAVTPQSIIEVDSIETARALVARSSGLSFMPGTAVFRSIARGDVVRLDLADLPPGRVRVVLVESAGNRPWAPLGTIKDLLRATSDAHAATLAPSGADRRG